jgi:GTP-binding protein
MKSKYIITSAEFVISYANYSSISNSANPEYAFTGRSNVGKSSLINMLTGRTHLAHTSATPGKTRLFNLFLVNKDWNLMDLPGFGYAKVSKSERKEWNKFIMEYLQNRKNLVSVFVLVDINIPPQETDISFINFLGENGIPFSVVFTKCDRSKKNALQKNITLFSNELYKYWEELPRIFKTSAITQEGKDELLEYIFVTNEETKEFLK